MVSWTPQAWVRGSRCDAPGCANSSLPEHRLVIRPGVGPALDIPLCLFFCAEHGDVASLFDRYLRLRGFG